MTASSIIIAIDGYSSTGKSSFAKLVAKKYGLLYLDSGALYRGVTLFAMEGGFIREGVFDFNSAAPFMGDMNLHFETAPDGTSHTFIGGRDVECEIRTMAVSNNVSIVAAKQEVRNFVDSILHSYADKGGVIMDGRDIGTTVFPNADLKLFMTADPVVRAQRRAAELQMKGQKADLDDVLRNLQERDYIDSHREASPLTQAPDAIVLDNTSMSFDDQMQWIGKLLKDKFNLTSVDEN